MGIKHYKKFAVTGVANKETLDAGIESNAAELRSITAILLRVNGYAANDIVGYVEEKKNVVVPDYLFDTEADLGAANFPYSTTKINRLELGYELKEGERFKIGILCGATNKNISGAYEYEIR